MIRPCASIKTWYLPNTKSTTSHPSIQPACAFGAFIWPSVATEFYRCSNAAKRKWNPFWYRLIGFWCLEAFSMLHQRNLNDPFIDWIVTCHKKWILYENPKPSPIRYQNTSSNTLHNSPWLPSQTNAYSWASSNFNILRNQQVSKFWCLIGKVEGMTLLLIFF